MFSLFSFLFALRLGTVPVYTTPALIPVRSEARELAAESVVQPTLPSQVAPGVTTRAPNVSQWVMNQASGPAVGPAFHTYRPDDWVLRFARQLNIEDLGITRLAVWLATVPVEMDLRPNRVFVRVTVKTK